MNSGLVVLIIALTIVIYLALELFALSIKWEGWKRRLDFKGNRVKKRGGK